MSKFGGLTAPQALMRVLTVASSSADYVASMDCFVGDTGNFPKAATVSMIHIAVFCECSEQTQHHPAGWCAWNVGL